MSAHVVSREHIDVLVCAAWEVACSGTTRMSWWRTDEDGRYVGWRSLSPSTMGSEPVVDEHELGQMLTDENVRSVRFRYPDDYKLPGNDMDWIEPYRAKTLGFSLTPGEVFKAIDSYCYQACEHPGWYASEANAFCRSLRAAWCVRVPGYAEAPWEWNLDGVIERRRGPQQALSLSVGIGSTSIR